MPSLEGTCRASDPLVKDQDIWLKIALKCPELIHIKETKKEKEQDSFTKVQDKLDVRLDLKPRLQSCKKSLSVPINTLASLVE